MNLAYFFIGFGCGGMAVSLCWLVNIIWAGPKSSPESVSASGLGNVRTANPPGVCRRGGI